MTDTTTETPGTSNTSEHATVRPQKMHAPLFWDVYRNTEPEVDTKRLQIKTSVDTPKD